MSKFKISDVVTYTISEINNEEFFTINYQEEGTSETIRAVLTEEEMFNIVNEFQQHQLRRSALTK